MKSIQLQEQVQKYHIVIMIPLQYWALNDFQAEINQYIRWRIALESWRSMVDVDIALDDLETVEMNHGVEDRRKL